MMKNYTLLSYIKKHIKTVIAFPISIIISCTIFILYQIPAECILYAAALCLAFSLFLIIPDYLKDRQKHILLYNLGKNITVCNPEFKDSQDRIEMDYQELIKLLFAEKSRLEMQAVKNSTDLVEYYTMWVHQIKTPIAAMRLLLQSAHSDHANELLPSMSMELFQIEQYVEMVLSYLRMESMSADLLIKRYALDDIMKQAVRKYAASFVHKRIHLNYSELNMDVLTDEKWLNFVLEQIISNALKYTREEGCISIYSHSSKPKTIVIEDTGIGINEEDLPRVYERGFTGYNGRSDKKSTGIGLYLCKNILTKLSHTITIESETGKGTKVLIGFETDEILAD